MNNQTPEIQALIDRNTRVEGDKSWEASWFGRLLISVITYISACAFLTITDGDHTRAYLPAFVPTMGYLLSSISLGPIKQWWIHNRYNH